MVEEKLFNELYCFLFEAKDTTEWKPKTILLGLQNVTSWKGRLRNTVCKNNTFLNENTEIKNKLPVFISSFNVFI